MQPRTTLRLAFLALATLVATSVAIAAEDYSKTPMTAARVAGNVWLVQGSGGNVAALTGPDGTVLVDSEFAPLAPRIAAALAAAGAKSSDVRWVVSTHWHWDHTDGNPHFARGGATVIAQDNVRRRLESASGFGNGASVHYDGKPPEPGVLPVLTFDRSATLFLNGEELRALHFPGAHTDGDVVLFFRHTNVVHAGDIFVRYGFPFIDLESGGSIDGMIDACRQLLSMLPPDVRIVPGHGAVASIADLREYLTMLEETRAAVASGIEAGKSLEQLKADKVLERWSARYSGDFISTDAFVETLYGSLRASR